MDGDAFDNYRSGNPGCGFLSILPLMKFLMFALLLITAPSVFGQKGEVVWMDFVTIKGNHEKEALYFYENNWKRYRDSALKAGVIKSYRIVKIAADSAGSRLVLFTTFHSLADYNRREAIFQPIMKSLRPAGPVFLNGLKRDEILTITDGYLAEVVF